MLLHIQSLSEALCCNNGASVGPVCQQRCLHAVSSHTDVHFFQIDIVFVFMSV